MDHTQASLLEYAEVAQILGTDLADGLTSFEARERLKKYGPNNLTGDTHQKAVPKYIYKSVLTYLGQFLNPLIQLLLICVLVSVAIGEYENAISVGLSILLVCTISYIQERRADKSLERLSKQMPSLCKVLREGQIHEMEVCCLVPGDVIYLQGGQRVPADVRLYDMVCLTVNEANLTGETQAQSKIQSPTSEQVTLVLSGDASTEADKNFIYQNLALMGTLVESGQSRGIVICTGKATRYGEVYSMLKSTVQPRSPLQVNIDQLSIHLVVISCSIIALMSMMGIVQQRPALEVAYYAISLAVTAIPEGLPVVVAVIMALGVLRLSKQKTIVKSLNSIETLGCIQVLCADKTGTLTRNDMTLTDIITSELHSLSSGELEELNNDECRKHMTFNKFGGKMYSIGRLMEAGTLCNNSQLDPAQRASGAAAGEAGNGGAGLQFIGQATECAILDAALRMGFGDSRTKFDRLSEVPFQSSTRRMVVLCKRLDLPSNSPMYYVKGAWEDILEDCTHYYDCGLVKPKCDDMWREYKRVCTALGARGLRVLALATGSSMEQLTFVGAIGINNALREGIADTLSKLRNTFHIEVKLITGDSRSTALAVSKTLQLIKDQANQDDEDQLAMSGEQLRTLLASNLDELAKAQEISSKSVFYRVDPVQKAEIVSKIQELDKIVAMTGDGVNDVISMKRANLSLVMGSGADVCKEIADVIMVDNDLSVLSQAVVEGKGIYHKINSFLAYQISISASLLLLIGVSFGARVEAPFTVIQLLFLNILTDGPPAQSLGVEKVDEKELDLRPRNVHEPLLSCHLFSTILTLTLSLTVVNGALYYLLLDDGKLDVHAESMLFTCFVLCSIFAATSLRSKVKTIFETRLFGNRELVCCNILVISIQMAILNLRFLNDLFNVQPLSILELVYLLLYSASVLIIMDTAKILMRVFDYIRHSLVTKYCGHKEGML